MSEYRGCGVGCEVQRECKLDKMVCRDSRAMVVSFRILHGNLQVIPGACGESVEELGAECFGSEQLQLER